MTVATIETYRVISGWRYIFAWMVIGGRAFKPADQWLAVGWGGCAGMVVGACIAWHEYRHGL